MDNKGNKMQTKSRMTRCSRAKSSVESLTFAFSDFDIVLILAIAKLEL